MFRTGRNTGRSDLVPAVPANTGCTGRYLNTGPKRKKAHIINYILVSKGKIVILLNPNSKTLTLPSCSRTALFLSFLLSQLLYNLCSLTLSANRSLTLSATPLRCLSLATALSVTRRRSVRHSLPLLCLSLSAALSLTLSATLR